MMSLLELKIKFSTDDLCDIYNQLSSELLQKILQNFKRDSIENMDNSLNNIQYLEKDSNYWVVDKERDYVLLPKKNQINQIFTDEQTDRIFDFRGKKSENFRLIKPAIVSHLSSKDGRWEIKEKGLLEFFDGDAIEKIATTSHNLECQNSQINLQTDNLIHQDKAAVDSHITSNLNNPESFVPSPKTIVEPSILNLVKTYNENPKFLLLDVIEVSETSQSIDNRRLDYNQAVALEKVSRNKGIAWVINIDGSDYLVLKPKLKINEYNYQTIEALFSCHGFELGISNEFQLVKPAKLLTQEKGERWELSEKGELLFREN